MMQRLKPLLTSPNFIALAAGALAATGFAPLNLWPLTLIGLAVLMSLVRAAPNWRAAAGRGWWWGFGHFILNCNWIAHAFIYQDNMPHWLGYVAVVGLALFFGPYIALVSGASWSFSSNPLPFRGEVDHAVAGSGEGTAAVSTPPLPTLSPKGERAILPFTLIFAACWIFGEMLRATLFTGFAWDPIGVVTVNGYFAFLAKWIGTYGISGTLVLVTGFTLCISKMKWRIVWIAGLALMVGIGPALVNHLAFVKPATSPLAELRSPPLLNIVQPNIPEDVGNDPAQNFNNLIKQMRLSSLPDPHHPHLILWPEGALTDFVEDEPWARQRLASILGPKDILAAGGDALVFDQTGHLSAARNSIFILNAQAQILGRYDKAHLVPGGEYLPLRPWLSLIGLNRLVPGDLDFIPGPGPRTLNVPSFGKMGAIICYEVIFSGEVVDRAHRPDFIFNPSTDAWFGSWGPPQHLAQAQMRALEEGIPIIRATTTGISAVIDANGQIEASQPLNTQGALISVIPPAAPPTFFSRYGNIIPLTLAFILGAIGIALARRKR